MATSLHRFLTGGSSQVKMRIENEHGCLFAASLGVLTINHSIAGNMLPCVVTQQQQLW